MKILTTAYTVEDSNFTITYKKEDSEKDQQLSINLKEYIRMGEGSKYKILIVEDDPVTLLVHRLLIKEQWPNADIRQARHGVHAVELIQDWTPHVVFCDYQMRADMNGIGVLQYFKNREHKMYDRLNKVLFYMVSCICNSEIIEEAKSWKCDDWVLKPLNESHLEEIDKRLNLIHFD